MSCEYLILPVHAKRSLMRALTSISYTIATQNYLPPNEDGGTFFYTFLEHHQLNDVYRTPCFHRDFSPRLVIQTILL